MGGIAGHAAREAGYINERETSFYAMRESLKRRGPDEDGMYMGGGAALIATRLRLSGSGGSQPMRFAHGGRRYVLVYNGELFNTGELRAELASLGYVFKDNSDTEVLGYAYIEWGADCLSRLNGMFAFAVWEESERRLFLARDRAGAKPLFYTVNNNSLIFASDIPTLLSHRDVKPILDTNGVAELIFLGPGRTPGAGVLRGIEEVEPAEYAEYQNGYLRKRKYWSLTACECNDTFAQAVEKTRYLVTDSIRKQVDCEANVCAFVSGGLDSGIVSAVAANRLAERGRKLFTFSLTYRDNDKHFKANRFQPNSDESYIKIMSEFLDSNHRDIILDTPELADALYTAVDARGLPGMADVDASLLLLCREAAKTAPVTLTGEGADEIFGGYPWYRDPEIRAAQGFPWAQNTQRRQMFLRQGINIDGEEYVGSRYRETIAECDILAGIPSGERRVREIMNLNFKWFMQTLVDRKDRMSMYSGLEARMPFSDHRIAEYLYSLPWDYKNYQNTEKGLLREAMRGLLPESVLYRKKSPYPKTHNPAYLEEVRRRMNGLLSRQDAPVFQFVRREALEALLTGEPSEPWYGQLMTVPQTIAYFLQINYWLERYGVTVVV